MSNIDDLPTECMLEIFSYLPANDRHHITNVSRKWNQLSLSNIKEIRFVSLSTTVEPGCDIIIGSLKTCLYILSKCEQIRRVSFHNFQNDRFSLEELLSCITNDLNYLQEITVSRSPTINDRLFAKIIRGSKQLRSINIWDCNIGVDSLHLISEKYDRVENVTLFLNLCVKNLQKLPKRLTTFKCLNWDFLNFSTFLTTSEQTLEYLYSPLYSSFTHLSKFTNLVELHVTQCCVFDSFSGLETLKKLKVLKIAFDSNVELTDGSIREILKNKQNLREFACRQMHIRHNDNVNITDESFELLCHSCPLLEVCVFEMANKLCNPISLVILKHLQEIEFTQCSNLQDEHVAELIRESASLRCVKLSPKRRFRKSYEAIMLNALNSNDEENANDIDDEDTTHCNPWRYRNFRWGEKSPNVSIFRDRFDFL